MVHKSTKIDLETDPIPPWTYDAEHEKKHAQWAWDTNQESLAWCLDGLIGEIERLRAALQGIADNPDPLDGKCYCRWSKGVARQALGSHD